jgi:hypothetical protein
MPCFITFDLYRATLEPSATNPAPQLQLEQAPSTSAGQTLDAVDRPHAALRNKIWDCYISFFELMFLSGCPSVQSQPIVTQFVLLVTLACLTFAASPGHLV